MTRERFDQIREKDQAVLQCIEDGEDTTRKIRESTTLNNRDVNYALDKLEGLGLIETQTPEGRVTKVVDGQKRNFKAPRQAYLTELGTEYIIETDQEGTQYKSISHDELVERVHQLEDEIQEIHSELEVFRKQVQTKLG